ncbi:hypothetical protein Hs20B_15040 [Lactococcus insecticola]|uniref:Uncharacterized protein n=2 Tax=Pseudolactococcus insecticola TaxID=2709158 RepID=A0A6A0B8C9_9LACT|nr:hypothetical protein Hs20B_15040 [Lactococcus insecticola]
MAFYALLGLLVNIGMVFFQIIFGHYHDIHLMMVTGIYQIAFILSRISGLRHYVALRTMQHNMPSFTSVYFLFGLGVAYFFVSIYDFYYGKPDVYSGSVIFFVPLFTFIKLGIAITSLSRVNRYNNHALTLLKQMAFSDALTSLVLTQNALLTWTGETANAVKSSAAFGMGVSLVIVLMAVYDYIKIRLLK